jgi:hypothetical protein
VTAGILPFVSALIVTSVPSNALVGVVGCLLNVSTIPAHNVPASEFVDPTQFVKVARNRRPFNPLEEGNVNVLLLTEPLITEPEGLVEVTAVHVEPTYWNHATLLTAGIAVASATAVNDTVFPVKMF